MLDADAANELIITDKDQTKQIESARQQIEEIAAMELGKKIPVSPRDNHEIHLQVLLQDIGTKVQQSAKQYNPAIVPLLKIEVEHGAQHLGFLKGDKTKKAIFKDLEDRLQLSTDAIKDLEKKGLDLAKQQFDQAAQLAQTPEQQAQVQQAQAQLEQQQNSL